MLFRSGPFEQTGILGYVLQRLDPLQTPVELATQYLRVIGNCVADNGEKNAIKRFGSHLLIQTADDNRNIVLPSFEKLIDCLERRSLAPIALAVILNLCNDFGKFSNPNS